ncbi:hepcidin-like [Gouania willdenowi]|uniref:hepcidin-like n=1 Tax=Gouania willdenowi TaxID=441366 RepID=UPI0010555B7A|nr:hepcidin-like [Gouania willdenowi]
MKTLSVFVAVAIVLTVMCSQQSSAVPVLQGEELEETIFLEIPDAVMDETVMDSMKGEELEETIFLEIPDAAMDETVMDSMKTLSNNRQKRELVCRKICCKNGVCDHCCYP